MRGRVVCLGLVAAMSVAGCAREPELGLSRLGAHDVRPQAAETDTADITEVSPAVTAERAVRHVTSNKVLGAMAFQKVTGRTVDPSRLSGQ